MKHYGSFISWFQYLMALLQGEVLGTVTNKKLSQ